MDEGATTVEISKSLHTELKIWCARRRMKIKDAAEHAVRQWLINQRKQVRPGDSGHWMEKETR